MTVQMNNNYKQPGAYSKALDSTVLSDELWRDSKTAFDDTYENSYVRELTLTISCKIASEQSANAHHRLIVNCM